MVSDKIFALILTRVFFYVLFPFTLATFKIFFVIYFQQFEYDMCDLFFSFGFILLEIYVSVV